MKNSLIGTSALVAASLLAGAAVAADAPASTSPLKLSVGGFGSAVVGYATQDKKFLKAYGEEVSEIDVKGDNEIHFEGRADLSNGLSVVAKYELEAGGNSSADDHHVDNYSVSLGGGFGTLVAGVTDTALIAVANRAPHMGGRLFGEGISEGSLIGGSWVLNPLNTQSGNTKTFIEASAIDSSYIHTGSATESISYMSPSIAGFTLGATYVPDSQQDAHDASQPKGKGVSEAYGVAVAYEKSFGGVDVAADIGWLKGGSKYSRKATQFDGIGSDFVTLAGGTNHTLRSRDRQEYQAGLNVSYSGVTVGGGYHLAKEKLGYDKDGATITLKEETLGLKGSAWEAGVGYKTGPYGVALAYLSSNQGSLKSKTGVLASPYKTRAVQLTAEYTLSPGVMLVGGVGHVSFDGKKADGKRLDDAFNNEGWVATTGLSLTF